jgi:glycosyltransferase involved in cell wall biosynthesis
MKLRVGIVCDLKEEQWHSMDLIADMLMERLPSVGGDAFAPSRLCPPMIPRWSRLALLGPSARLRLADRLTGRLWDYPRWLARRVPDFDLFHIVDQSYAHLVRVLPPQRTIVTCHDIDAVRAALPGGGRLGPARLLASRILDGLGRAAHVCCVSRATRDDLVATGGVDPQRVSVVYEGAHPSCSPTAVPEWDQEIARRINCIPNAAAAAGARLAHVDARIDVLHVGSTIPRKRIDVLIEILAGLRRTIDSVRLVRVGGGLAPAQRALASRLNVADSILELPYLERPALAALYRRASLVLLPSEREGFGLPVIEAMACGTPVVASDIPALREVGGAAATYCPPGRAPDWIEKIAELLNERSAAPAGWMKRREASLAQAARFDWWTYAREMTQLYVQVAASSGLPNLASKTTD